MICPFWFELVGFGRRRGPFLEGAKQRTLPAQSIGDNAGSASQSAVDLRKKTGSGLTETVAGAAFDQGFQNFPIDRAAIDSLTHVGKRVELASFIARFKDRLHRNFADTFDSRQTEAYDLARKTVNPTWRPFAIGAG